MRLLLGDSHLARTTTIWFNGEGCGSESENASASDGGDHRDGASANESENESESGDRDGGCESGGEGCESANANESASLNKQSKRIKNTKETRIYTVVGLVSAAVAAARRRTALARRNDKEGEGEESGGADLGFPMYWPGVGE